MSLEIENKFDASDVSLSSFMLKMEKMGAHYYRHHGYTDHYFQEYIGPLYVRYRDHISHGELTIKQETDVSNTRRELNLAVAGQDLENIKVFLKAINYKYSFPLKKDCHVFLLEGLNITYDLLTTVDNHLVKVVEIEQKEGCKPRFLAEVTDVLSSSLPLVPLYQNNFERFRP